jgi:hypothetical protein
MIERARTIERRHDYRWNADRTTGFEQSTFLYDAEGRLIGVDYLPAREKRADEAIVVRRPEQM